MVWTKELAAVQALERGRGVMLAFLLDIGHVIDVLTPGGAAAAGGNEVDGELVGTITVPREMFAETIAAYCACNCPTQIVGQPGRHTPECVEMRALLYPVGATIDTSAQLSERILAATRERGRQSSAVICYCRKNPCVCVPV